MNTATLAVAGARKTQSIVDACTNGEAGKRRLVVTYTLSGQRDLERRLSAACPTTMPDVIGWYSFLLRHWVKPFLPLLYQGRRLAGLNFDGVPRMNKQGVVIASGADRYLDEESRAYKRFLSKLAIDVAGAAGGAVVSRLERMYDEVFVDEVQDMTGYDLDVLEKLLRSKSSIRLVGDIRQSVFDTNPQDPRHRQYRGLKMLDWFNEQKNSGCLEIQYSSTTHRSNQAVATFSDTIFRSDLGFPATESAQTAVSDHDGVFAVATEHAEAYAAHFQPACLRQLVTSPVPDGMFATNFGLAKGLTHARVLIFTTEPMRKFLIQGAVLTDKSACALYVGVTRAVHSVAFVMAKPERTSLEVWSPSG